MLMLVQGQRPKRTRSAQKRAWRWALWIFLIPIITRRCVTPMSARGQIAVSFLLLPPDLISTSFPIALDTGAWAWAWADIGSGQKLGFTAAERGTRRKLWWYILHGDVISSCSGELSPLFIDEKMTKKKGLKGLWIERQVFRTLLLHTLPCALATSRDPSR